MERACRFDSARRHFVERVHERIGPSVPGERLWDEIRRALLDENEEFVRFRCNDKNGRAIFRTKIAGQEWFIVAHKAECCPITVLPRDHAVYSPWFRSRQRKAKPMRRPDRPPARRPMRGWE